MKFTSNRPDDGAEAFRAAIDAENTTEEYFDDIRYQLEEAGVAGGLIVQGILRKGSQYRLCPFFVDEVVVAWDYDVSVPEGAVTVTIKAYAMKVGTTDFGAKISVLSLDDVEPFPFAEDLTSSWGDTWGWLPLEDV